MKIIETKTLTASTSLILNKNQQGDTVTSELYLNPLQDCSITVTGFVSPDDPNGITLKAIDVANLKKVDSITTAGNYCFMTGSYYKVDIELTGDATVLCKTLF